MRNHRSRTNERIAVEGQIRVTSSLAVVFLTVDLSWEIACKVMDEPDTLHRDYKVEHMDCSVNPFCQTESPPLASRPRIPFHKGIA